MSSRGYFPGVPGLEGELWFLFLAMGLAHRGEVGRWGREEQSPFAQAQVSVPWDTEVIS